MTSDIIKTPSDEDGAYMEKTEFGDMLCHRENVLERSIKKMLEHTSKDDGFHFKDFKS